MNMSTIVKNIFISFLQMNNMIWSFINLKSFSNILSVETKVCKVLKGFIFLNYDNNPEIQQCEWAHFFI